MKSVKITWIGQDALAREAVRALCAGGIEAVQAEVGAVQPGQAVALSVDGEEGQLAALRALGAAQGTLVMNFGYLPLAAVEGVAQCAKQLGLRYLSAAVLSYADDLGGPDGYLAVSGDAADYEAAKRALCALGTVEYTGENLVGAKLLAYTATGAQSIFELSFLDGLALCAKYGYDTDGYVHHTQKAMPPLAEAAHRNIFLCLNSGEDYGHFDDNIHAMEQLVDLIQKSGAQPELTAERQKAIHDMLDEHWNSVMESYRLKGEGEEQ